MRIKLINKTHFKPFSATKSIKVMVMFIFFTLFLVGTVTAFEFDNVKSYNEKTKTYSVTNAFGLGDEIAQITLNTPTNNKVGAGYRKVAEFTVNNFDDYINVFNDMEFFDLRKGGEKFIRNFDYKYKTIIQIPDYKTICDKKLSVNGTLENLNCRQEQIGFKDKETWIKINKETGLLKGNITIGIFTEVKVGDKVEWIPTLYGERLTDWAVWTADLNVDLLYYWAFEEASGDFETGDELLDNNLTVQGTVTRVVGKIGNAVEFNDNTANFLQSLNNVGITGNDDRTICLWTEEDVVVGTDPYIDWGTDFNNKHFLIYSASSLLQIGIFGTDFSTGVAPTTSFDFHCTVFDGTTTNWYRNSISIANLSMGTTNTGDSVLTVGIVTYFGPQAFDGIIDELGIWNRTLTGAEVVQLYNEGTGITFVPIFPPTITLNSPVDTFNSTSQTINFNGTVVDATGIANVSLILDGIFNETNSSGINNTDYLFTKVISDGNHNWTYEACDDDECTTATTRTFLIDTVFPIVNVTSPTGDQGTFFSGRNLTLNWTVIDANPHICWYDYGGTNTTVTCNDNTTNLTVTDSTLTSLIFYANDTIGQQNFDTTNWSYSFIENSVTFNENVSETSSQFFELNLSTSLSVLSISAQLNYNGTNFVSKASCNGNCIVNNTIDIPLVSSGESEFKDFFWNINIFNGTDSISVSSSTQQQNVTRIHLEKCDGTYTVQTLNFSAYNEQNLTRINPYKFDATFDQWLGSGSVKRNNNFSNSSTAEETLCILPSDKTYFVDGQIDYDETGNETTYVARNYYFQNDTINNVSEDIFLYLLESTLSTSFILKVQDNNLLPLENYLVFIQKFYTGENLFRTVQIAKTGTNGKTVGFFETEIVDYRFIIKNNGRTLLTTLQQKIIGETAPFTITFTIGEDLGKPWKDLEELDDLTFTLDFNKSSNIVTYTYADTSGNFTLGTLVVERQNFSFATNTIFCNLNSSQSSATLTCNLTGNSTGTYRAGGFITRGGIENLVQQINFIIETFLEIVGMLGVFLAWFLILISSFAFKFNEIAGIFMINATVIFVNLIGLVSFGMLAISALIAVSIIIVVVMEK